VTMPRLASRLRENWSRASRRLQAARQRRAPVDWRRIVILAIAGLVAVVLTALFFDARVIAWTETLSPAVHGFFAWSTRFGQSDWLLIPAGIIVIVVMLGDWRGVSRINAAAWWEIGSFAAVFFVVVAVPGLVTDIVKPIVGRFRPDFVHEGAFAFAPLSFGGYAHYSFPSGHATTMGAVAVLAAFVPSMVTIPILMATVVVAISRVMIGVHFPSDVVAGALIGASVGYFILRGMAAAGIVFVRRPDGSIRGRFGVLRSVRRGKDGLAALFPALWVALSRH
jgi:membrane-associated phospholipid phosphatase